MKELNRSSIDFATHPERILQIGEGNFLRCFVGWQVDILNERTALMPVSLSPGRSIPRRRQH